MSADVNSNFADIKTAFNALVTGNNQIDVDTIRENTSAAGVTFGHFTKFNLGSVTASTNQTQGQSPMTATINNVTCANEQDVVTLPAAAAGRWCVVINNSASAALKVYAASGDAMNGTLNGSTSVGATAVGIFFAVDATTWYASL